LIWANQTRSIELPSDSNFAIAMQVQKEAERVERQNIKNLVLNYDLQESGVDPAGTIHQFYLDPFLPPNPNIRHPPPSRPAAHYHLFQGPGGDKHAPAQHSNNASLHQPSLKSGADAKSADKSATNRSGHRARKLQLSDVDWYESRPGPPHPGGSRGPLRRIAG
jgi:regulator of nonsense transcripts 2